MSARLQLSTFLERFPVLPSELFSHPLATPNWESEPASPVRLHTRSSWTTPAADEPAAPAQRIIHSRALFTDTPARIDRVSVGAAPGYHKCASGQERDAIVDLTLYAPDGPTAWKEVGRIRSDAETVLSEGAHLDLDGLETTALVARARQAVTDTWWPGWNLVTTGISVTGEVSPEWTPGPEGALTVTEADIDSLPYGVTARLTHTEVRYSTPYLEVGFRLISPAWSHFSVDADGTGRTHTNLLQMPRSMDIVRSGVYPSGVYPVLRDQNAEYLAQGPRFTSITGQMPLGFLRSDYRGTTSIRGNVVSYEVTSDTAGQSYRYEFRIERDRIEVSITRSAAEERRAWTSSAWHIATNNRVTPSTTLGQLTGFGETGLLSGEVAWHFPRYGTVTISASETAQLRSDSVRPLDTNTLEIKVGEEATEFGDYILPAGEHHTSFTMTVQTPELATLEHRTPAPVRRALSRHTLTALSFRPDTATYSNNGASMHCTTSLQDVSAIASQLDASASLTPMAWVGTSLQRWLDGAPSYGSGATSHGTHRLEDEYVQMAANTLMAAGRYVAWEGSGDWFERNRDGLLRELSDMLARDVDGDGIVESTIRVGNSGEHQWSSSWADVISFGWKDAWANAVVFDMWSLWAPLLRDRGEDVLAARIEESAAAMQRNFLDAFLNAETGLIAGWRSKDGELHDYGFSLVTGAACATELIPVDTAREIMRSLADHWTRLGITDFRNGLPLNLWRIPEKDIGGVIFGLPMGGYQQGGYSHHGTRVVVDALDRVGMNELADTVLEQLCRTIADDTSFGGLGSGIDWRMADGTPTGYEGQLVEGFSVLASALRRHRAAES